MLTPAYTMSYIACAFSLSLYMISPCQAPLLTLLLQRIAEVVSTEAALLGVNRLPSPPHPRPSHASHTLPSSRICVADGSGSTVASEPRPHAADATLLLPLERAPPIPAVANDADFHCSTDYGGSDSSSGCGGEGADAGAATDGSGAAASFGGSLSADGPATATAADGPAADGGEDGSPPPPPPPPPPRLASPAPGPRLEEVRGVLHELRMYEPALVAAVMTCISRLPPEGTVFYIANAGELCFSAVLLHTSRAAPRRIFNMPRDVRACALVVSCGSTVQHNGYHTSIGRWS